MHNYAKPLTEEARLARVLQRLPGDWTMTVERPANGAWHVHAARPDAAMAEARASSLVEAMEEVWRALR